MRSDASAIRAGGSRASRRATPAPPAHESGRLREHRLVAVLVVAMLALALAAPAHARTVEVALGDAVSVDFPRSILAGAPLEIDARLPFRIEPLPDLGEFMRARLVALSPGSFEVVLRAGAVGAPADALPTRALDTLEVSVVASAGYLVETAELRPPKVPLAPPAPRPSWALLAVAAGAAFLVTALRVRALRAIAPPPSVAAAPPPVDPFAALLSELDAVAIAAAALPSTLSREEGRAIAARLADAVSLYLSRRFDMRRGEIDISHVARLDPSLASVLESARPLLFGHAVAARFDLEDMQDRVRSAAVRLERTGGLAS